MPESQMLGQSSDVMLLGWNSSRNMSLLNIHGHKIHINLHICNKSPSVVGVQIAFDHT